MKIIDVHAHYEDEKYNENREEIINRQFARGVEYIINAGAGIESSKAAIEIANKYRNVYCTIGIHPQYVENGETIDDLRKLYVESNKNKIVELGLPVQIHSRDASIDTVELLESVEKKPEKIMFHCFDLNEQTARYIIQKGYKISLGGNITYKRTETAIKVIKEMPLESIMTETDSPYLSPASQRGTTNQSLNINEVIEKIAEIKGISKEEVERIVYNNAIEFYGLK